ncbi:soluble lytic murein transglycosylase [Synechococcus sp. MIT S9220]|uniref:lytic transglycosylase domain-containing protein n=1 Tax=unclassified Synechococcus TaxID=2626047 RepID=UPI00164A92E3|nr:lytic transglycosylase domain-containing protein [Synechococcus sp. MIT S9220]NOL47907.1 lytic transglycosylase domain-containing protein [Synechococcus sp. MIT S9220]QNJ21672.1 soluble lytic murein transglycosylase [Synechococcus sp. MIT S9220]
MPAVSSHGLNTRETRGPLLLGGTTLLTVLAILGGRVLLRSQHHPITPELSDAQLWTHYRWSGNPEQRREAALMLGSRSDDSPQRRWHLLSGQGWGPAPMAAVALKQQALAAKSLGRDGEEQQHWRDLLRRFPTSTASADARYHLADRQPQLREELLRLQPAHPAALAAAAELPDDADQALVQSSALHLARWGANWPGAQRLLRKACGAITGEGLEQQQRLQLAAALAELGDGRSAELCLQGTPLAPSQALTIGRTLLRGNQDQQQRGEAMLLQLAKDHPDSEEALQSAALLSEPLLPKQALINALPESLQKRSADVAAARVRLAGGEGGLVVLKRWPGHPASWQLQWDLAREALLKGQWEPARSWLTAIPAEQLPDPLRARQQFWLGMSLDKLGDRQAAKEIWQTLTRQQPPGYYTWRAQARLGSGNLPALSGDKVITATEADRLNSGQTWSPLDSGNPLVDQLWRLEMNQEAWETWRSDAGNSDPSPQQLLREGRLRLAVNDHWTGLSRLWRASLRLVSPDCNTRQLLHNSLHPRPLLPLFLAASEQEKVRLELLLAIARQESRFSPGVTSPVGAVGLLQLMPATAAELAGEELSSDDLREPERNAILGARYLADLLELWQGNPWLTVASYNAGPGAAGSWVSAELDQDPELWVERIPYPETRLYTKKVLGNLWAYLNNSSGNDASTDRCSQ